MTARSCCNNLLDIDDLPVRVRRLIMRKADGNPFFLEEIIRTLVSTGAVVRSPATGRLEATGRLWRTSPFQTRSRASSRPG